MLSVSGCRGIVGRSLTPEVVSRYVSSAAWWAGRVSGGAAEPPQPPAFVLARDGRAGGEAIALVAAGTLAACGCRVIDLGIATTPTVGVMVRESGAGAGLVLTASHNPGEWNGIKVIDRRGAAPPAASAAEIIARFRDASSSASQYRPSSQIGRVERDTSSAQVHVKKVLGALERLCPVQAIRERKFKVVLDSVNASGAVAGALLLESLGCTLTHLNREATGVFPHPPEPTQENLASLGEQVRAHKADIGFAQDPDADRLAMLDEAGRYIGEEYTLVLAVKAALSMGGAKGGAVAANLSTSRMIDDVAAALGARVVRTAVGEANVVSGMEANHCAIGGEGNGGVIWPEVVPIRDSLGAMALTLALLARDKSTLSAAAAKIPAYAIVKRKIDVREGLTAKALEAARRQFSKPGVRVSDIDGIRADFDLSTGGSGWVHVRASNTEPIIRLIAEAPSKAEAERVLDEVQAAIDRA